MSQCRRRLGKCAFDYEMFFYPPLTIKVVTQAFVCTELCLFLGRYSQSSSLWPAALSHWSRLELSWLLEDFHNSFSNGHSSNISSANAGLPKGWKMDMGIWFFKQLGEGPMSHLTEGVVRGSGEGKINRKSDYSTIRLRVYSPSLVDINIIETRLLYEYLASYCKALLVFSRGHSDDYNQKSHTNNIIKIWLLSEPYQYWDKKCQTIFQGCRRRRSWRFFLGLVKNTDPAVSSFDEQLFHLKKVCIYSWARGWCLWQGRLLTLMASSSAQLKSSSELPSAW